MSDYVKELCIWVPGTGGKIRGLTAGAASSYMPAETGMSMPMPMPMPMQFAGSSFDNQGFVVKMHKDGMESISAAQNPAELNSGKGIAGKSSDHEGGANVLPNVNKFVQVSFYWHVFTTSG